MVNLNVNIQLYSFDELSDQAKKTAIEEHREFMLDVAHYNLFEDEDDFIFYYESLLTNDSLIIENIKCNDYLFFKDGSLANVTCYMRNDKCYKKEFCFMGDTYEFL